MKAWLLALLVLTSSGFHASARAAELERRLEGLPGESWMDGVRTLLLLAAGSPSLAGPSTESGVHVEWRVEEGLALLLDLGLLRAAAFSEERLAMGLAWAGPHWVVRLRWEGSRAGVDGLISESRQRLLSAITLRIASIRVGLRRQGTLGAPDQYLREEIAWGFAWGRGPLGVALLREDARWGGSASWSPGVQLRLHPSLRIGLIGEDGQGMVSLVTRRGRLGLRLSLPVASSIAAGPYLGLAWNGSGTELWP